MHWIIRLGLSIAFFGAIVYADRRERRLLLFLLFGAVLALWLFGLLGLFGLPPASLYLSGVVGISPGLCHSQSGPLEKKENAWDRRFVIDRCGLRFQGGRAL
ncbi:MAG: hypothetical protein ACLT9P_06955 [Evtepia gabavorous]